MGKIRKALWKFFNNRLAFVLFLFSFLASLLILPVVWTAPWPWVMWVAKAARKHPSTYGFLHSTISSLTASLILAWAAYIWRVNIRRFFQPQIIYIRAPLMLGVAPLIVARSREVGIWDKHGLNMDLDFRYAGRQALEDLFKPDSLCPIAVASDVALSRFLSKPENRSHKVKVIPFVRIEDHLKIVVRKNGDGQLEYAKPGDLKGKSIGYYPDSVHGDFLAKLEIFDEQMMKSKNTVLECYHALAVSREVEACVLWEPHYYAFTKFNDVGTVNNIDPSPYKWFLCLVAREDYTRHNEQVAAKILWAIKDAADYCQSEDHRPSVIRDCASFLHTEFTGIDEEGLRTLLNKNHHVFGVDDLLKPFGEKLSALIDNGTQQLRFGAATLQRSLWKSLSIDD